MINVGQKKVRHPLYLLQRYQGTFPPRDRTSELTGVFFFFFQADIP